MAGQGDDDTLEYSSAGIGYYAMRLALTRSIHEENELKKEYANNPDIQFVVTEVGGNTKKDFQEKVTRSVLGAALNAGLISKRPNEVHALFHAAEEAKRGTIVNISSDAHLAMKVAIVRTKYWIAVALFGDSAIHPITSHERCGLGIMNI